MISKVYVLPDDQGRILRIEGQYSLPIDLAGWVLIEEGEPCDRLNLAQSHYFKDGIYTEDLILRYKLVDGKPVERTNDELEVDRLERDSIIGTNTPTIEDRVSTLENSNEETKEALEMILNGVVE